MSQITANIALGSNIGDPATNVRQAIEHIARLGILSARSSLYATKPWGVTDQPDFCNAVVQISLDPAVTAQLLLAQLQDIEQLMGRTATYRWGPRLIDLDLLTYGDQVINEPNLKVPHPMINERAFVLVPLAEIDSRFKAARDRLSASALGEVRLII